MKEIVLFVLLGLGAGAVIAGIAMAVVVTFSGSGIINLSTGAILMVAAYTFWALKSGYFHFTLSTPPAIVVTIVVSIVVGVVSERWSSARCEHPRHSPSWWPRSGSC